MNGLCNGCGKKLKTKRISGTYCDECWQRLYGGRMIHEPSDIIQEEIKIRKKLNKVLQTRIDANNKKIEELNAINH